MSIATVLRRSLVGLGSLVAAVCASELLAPYTTKHIVPEVTYYPTTTGNSRLVIICQHGLWSPEYFLEQLKELRELGNVVMVKTGANVLDNVPAVVAKLKELKLEGYTLFLNGFSRGTRDLLRALDRFDAEGWPVAYAFVNSGPAEGSVKWPTQLVPLSARILRGGPLLQWIWQLYWRRRGDEGKGPLGVHVRSVVTGIRDLSQIKPWQRSYPTVRAFLIRHAGIDPRVRECDAAWLKIFPNMQIVLVPGDGHGEYHLYPEVFQQAYRQCLSMGPVAA